MPYTVASTLEDILTQKREVARQQQLDALNKQNVESEISSRAENTKSMADQRQAAIDQKNLAFLTAGGHDENESITDPGILRAGEMAGLIKHTLPAPIPSVSTNTQLSPVPGLDMPSAKMDQYNAISGSPDNEQKGPINQTPSVPPQTGNFYKGDPSDLEAKRVNSEMDSLITSGYFGDPTSEPVKRMLNVLKINQVFRQKPPSTEYTGLLKPQGHRYILNDGTGKVSEAMGPDNQPLGTEDQITTIPRPPQAPTPPYIGTQNGNPVLLIGGKPTVVPLQGGATLDSGAAAPIEAKPATIPPPKNYQIPPAAQAGLAKLRSKAIPTTGLFGTTQPRDPDVAAFRQAADIQINNYPTSPDVKDTVRDVIENAPQEDDTNAIIQQHKAAFKTPKEWEDFAALLHMFR